jgi:hypothetical protein
MLFLKQELRGAFSSLEQVDIKECARLPFLNACINKSLRLLPLLAEKFISRRSLEVIIVRSVARAPN